MGTLIDLSQYKKRTPEELAEAEKARLEAFELMAEEARKIEERRKHNERVIRNWKKQQKRVK